MKRALLALLLTGAVAVGCAPPGGDDDKEPSAAAGVTPRPGPSKKVGGTYKLRTTIKTEAGSLITVAGWGRTAPKREDAPGPGQVYESIAVAFCAGPDVDVTGRELVPFFSLELPNGNRVSPDSATGDRELRAKGKIPPGTCVYAPIVFQVGGGTKPKYVVFESTPKATRWTVP
jgi:hypothetical protein